MKIIEFKEDVIKYFKNKYPKLKDGCTCDERSGDYTYEFLKK